MNTKPKSRGLPSVSYKAALERSFTNVVVANFRRQAAFDYVFGDNLVSAAVPPGSSPRECIEIVAARAERPIPIESLPEELKAPGLPRGKRFFGQAGALIDEIAASWELSWWISGVGLTMRRLDQVSALSDFDATIGGLVVEHFIDGRLARGADVIIAKAADEKGLRLSDHLPPKQYKALAEHNQHNPKRALKTFEAAVTDRLGRRGVLLSFYEARRRFMAQSAK